MTATQHKEEGWKIDRHVPLAIIMTLLLQTAAAGIWAGALNARVGKLEQEADGGRTVAERVTRLEEKVSAVKDDVAVVKDLVKDVGDKLDRRASR